MPRTKRLDIGCETKASATIGGEWDTLDCVGDPTILHDLSVFPYPINDNAYNHIYISHTLEHVSWTKTEDVLRELCRVLKPGGLLDVRVPDLDKILAMYAEGVKRADNFYPHNPQKSDILWLNGRLFFFGEHNDLHKAVFNEEYLKECLIKCGLINVKRVNAKYGVGDYRYTDLWLEAYKPSLI